jgi:hypothetical protein
MAVNLSQSYLLSFAGVPFVSDDLEAAQWQIEAFDGEDLSVKLDPKKLPHWSQQPLPDLIDDLERLLPSVYLRDYAHPKLIGRNVNLLAEQPADHPAPHDLRLYDFYYPPSATRWGVFRGLMTSGMVKRVLQTTQGGAGTFVMRQIPEAPGNPTSSLYTLQTSMYMLPPRCLGEGAFAENFDGLYLVTLVDERYWLQGTPVTLHVRHDTTWPQLITQIADAAHITVSHSTIEDVYLQPEPDSQLWANEESVAVLLDAVAYNLGRVVVRNLGGSYALYTGDESATRVLSSRPLALNAGRVVGGDMFQSGTWLPVGSLFAAKNSVVAPTVSVTFPKYVQGDDPVPHFLNPRYQNQRPSTWFEDGYGATHIANVPVASGGPSVSGVTGASGQVQVLHATAKALYSGEAQARSGGAPLNASGLLALATQLATNYWVGQTITALDEVYPGTFAWSPEGIHDLVWTYSARNRVAALRVVHTEWNVPPTEFQHATPPLSGFTNTPKGVGGPSVAQTVRDSVSGGYQGLLASSLSSGGTFLNLSGGSYPTSRWRAQIGGEVVFAEGPSVVYRGIDGSVQQSHAAGTAVTEITPHPAYGVNLLTFGQGFAVNQQAWTSGGVSEARVTFSSPSSGSSACASGLANPPPSYYPLCGSGGTLQVWKQESTLSFQGGCPVYTKTPWEFQLDTCAPCLCSGQRPPDNLYWCVTSGGTTSCIALGTTPPTAVGGPHQSPGECESNCSETWYCVSNGGSPTCVQSATVPAGAIAVYPSEDECLANCAGGGGGGTIPPCDDALNCGSCVPESHVPVSQHIDARGFSGDVSVFNGSWILAQTSGCTWSQLRSDGSRAILTISGSAYTLRFFAAVEGDIAVSAAYQAAFNGFCCITQTPSLVSYSGGGAPSTLTVVPNCCSEGESGYWCVSNGGNPICVPGTIDNPPAGAIAFYESQGECETECHGGTPVTVCCGAGNLQVNVTITNVSDCPAIDLSPGDYTDQPIPIVTSDEWSGSVGASDPTFAVRLYCEDNEYKLDVSSAGGVCFGFVAVTLRDPDVVTCGPPDTAFQVEFNDRLITWQGDPSCCGPGTTAVLSFKFSGD